MAALACARGRRAARNPRHAPAPNMRGDGPAPAAKPFSMTRSDPALDAIVARNAEAELLASGFGLNEGPVWVPEGNSGYLLVGGLLDNVIYKIAADKEVSVFMEQAGYSGTDVSNTGTQTRSGRSHVLLIGPSCASLDSQGRLIWCADNDRTVMRLEKDGTRTVLSAGAPDGKRFSGPNDIVVARDDAVYLTDNDFGLRGAGRSPDKQMPNGIWRIKDGVSTLVLERGGARRHTERHRVVARRALSLSLGAAKDDALRGAARRLARRRQPVHRRPRHRRRHEGRRRTATSIRRAAQAPASSASRRRAARCWAT